ncbi:MAG: PepSY-associated TM helix domain-containing protein [Nostoc sp.]|uniref:PepSY-associated TM helix domain-containing protein n=1 Tax=Nostoc sp. TaxID=1180 RepID=UPI002FF990CA
MNARIIRNTAFHLHRWLGLIGGTLLSIAGLTGSVLVFWHEIDRIVLAQRFGRIIPGKEQVSIHAIADTVKTVYASKGLTIGGVSLPEHIDQPYQVWLNDAADRVWYVFVNPYTGQVMGDRQWETSWIGSIYSLHYKLLAGDIGQWIMGIVALLTLILSITGIILWPGWRKLITGFKIKWQKAHIKRTNFDIHKVAGIITAVFLAFIGFTGFAWNIPQAKVTDIIYAATLTPKPAEPVSKPISLQQPLAIKDLLQRADAAVPNAITTYVSFANKQEEPFHVGKKQAQETGQYGTTQVYLDQFTGKVIQINDGVKPSRAEAILNQFGSVHFGTFGGRLTQVLYVFVGLAPTVLMVTGVVMWWYRRRVKVGTQREVNVAAEVKW